MDNEEAYQRARKRVEAKIGFYIHVGAYAGVNILLIMINLVTTPGVLWFKWPLIGWGFGVFFHFLAVFALFKGSSWKERLIEKELDRETRRQKGDR
jgi:hypothetical protein